MGKSKTTRKSKALKTTNDVTAVPGVLAYWQDALLKRAQLLTPHNEVVIYRRTDGPPKEFKGNYRLWRQRYPQLAGEEYGWEQGWDESDNKPIGYKLFILPAGKYLPEKGDQALEKAIRKALGGGGTGPPSEVGPR